jgi:thiol-disulfide isomerase/thioredoxin
MLLDVSAEYLRCEGECRTPAPPPPGWCPPISLRTWIGVGLIASLLMSPGTSPSAQQSPAATSLPIDFRREIANIEYGADAFRSEAPKRLIRPQVSDRKLWFGQIRRRFPGEQLSSTAHDVAIAVEYGGRCPVRAWCDSNLNNDLSDDPEVKLYPYPEPGASAFLVDLAWNTPDQDARPIEWKVRVVLEQFDLLKSSPRYRTQQVFGMVGAIPVEGREARAFLFDGNHDGVYTASYGDGMFVDLDGDSLFKIDQMSPEFLPFTVPFQLGDAMFRIASLDEEGRSLNLVRVDAKASSPPIQGQAAPDFAFQDWKTGREVRLADYRGHPVVVYFWAGWCGSCEELAPSMRALYDRMHPRGVEILGVSYDTDSTRFLGYLERHPEPWPISFTGRRFWENPVGRLYRANAAGTAILVDPAGRLDGVFYEPQDLNVRLEEILKEIDPSRSDAGRNTRARTKGSQ